MERHFKITVEGHAYDVVVEEILPEAGMLYPDRGSMVPRPAAAVRPASAAAPPQAPAQGSPRGSAGPGDVVCPIAGVVTTIAVAVGDTVSEGLPVVTLEAMKTKTVVTAARAGKVGAINVKVGDAVDAGQTLLVIG
jgi:biotin carboxyl carrier protein